MLKKIKHYGVSTTAHGWGRLAETRTRLGGCLWFCVISAVYALLTAHITILAIDYVSYPKVVVVTESLTRYTFPKITICPTPVWSADLIRRDTESYFIAAYNNLRNIANKYQLKPTDTNDFILRVLNEAAESATFSKLSIFQGKISDTLISCEYNGRPCGMADFQPFITEYYGMCYSFKPHQVGYHYANFYGGLRLRMFIENDDLDLPFPLLVNNMRGALLEIVRRHTFINFKRTIPVVAATGLVTNIGVSYQDFDRLSTWNDPCVNYFDTFLCNLYQLHQFLYSPVHCLDSEGNAHIYLECDCVSTYYPIGPALVNARRCLSVEGDATNFTVTNSDQVMADFLCMRAVSEGHLRHASMEEAKCPKSCLDRNLQKHLSVGRIATDRKSERMLADLIQQQIRRVQDSGINSTFLSDVLVANGSSLNLAKFSIENNILDLNIFVASTKTLQFKEELRYTFVSFTSLIGGTMGLWVGASCITIFEVISFALDFMTAFCFRPPQKDEENCIMDTKEPIL